MGREHWVVMGRFPHSLEQESDDVWVTCDACLPEDVADRILNLEDLRLKVYAGENKIDLDAVSRPAFPAQ